MFVLNFIMKRPELLLVLLPVVPLIVYAGCYVLLRVLGRLVVSGHGWQAASIYLGARILVPAFGLFGFFQPLLRIESAFVRFIEGDAETAPREHGVSDVVVEVVPMA